MARDGFFRYGEKEIAYLKGKDKKLAAAMDLIGPVERPVDSDLFESLIDSVVGQQISTKAHITIRERMARRFGPFTPEIVAGISAEDLQACGITMKKAVYIKEIAEEVLAGRLDLEKLPTLSDAEVAAALTRLRGIGIWTAEMLMIFCLQRPDILSYDDLAIRRGLRMLYGRREITKEFFERCRKRYSPHGSVASLYLWAVASGRYAEYSDPAQKAKESPAAGKKTPGEKKTHRKEKS
ncbi:MAG: DNA-3-methyladenine glycosylase [Fusobacteriaceae bacterium]|jgi:DNA-3-methyladenine glycosylase II|nr:DNA-3-methyladenine glycosylase [Fusobacteriaceae bacterium]